MLKVEVRNAFNYDSDKVSDQTGLKCMDDSMTSQADAEDTDINVLVKRFGLTGEMPVLNRLPISADFVPTMDYHSALNQLQEADDIFMELPAEVRKRFDHDPGAFVNFCSDEKNREELVKMGLVVEKPKNEPLEVFMKEAKPPRGEGVT